MSIKNLATSSDTINRDKSQRNKVMVVVTIGLIIFGVVFSINSLRQSSVTAVDGNGSVTPVYSDALPSLYAEPWLNQEQPAAVFSDDLSQQYAQPWIDQIQANKLTSSAQGNGLVMQYAQPWIDMLEAKSCNGRLDMRYACANGHQP